MPGAEPYKPALRIRVTFVLTRNNRKAKSLSTKRKEPFDGHRTRSDGALGRDGLNTITLDARMGPGRGFFYA